MIYQGDFDPNGYVEGNPATYPQPSTATTYEPSMWWRVDTPGTFGTYTGVNVGDRIFVVGHARTYGESDYGDQTYGPPQDRTWTEDSVSFTLWRSNLPPDLTGATPYSGCPLGDRWPGWRIVVDAYYNPDTTARTYGTDTYGDDVYGDAAGVGAPMWVDLTEPSFSAVIGAGSPTGDQIQVIPQIVVELVDPAGDWFDIAVPRSWFTPSPGTPFRVGVLDPAQNYQPLMTGAIERISDDHDRQPRIVTVEAFGFMMDLANTLQLWQNRSGRTIQYETNRLLRAAGWRWGQPVTWPAATGPILLGDYQPVDVNARERLDLMMVSAGWTVDTYRAGSMRVVEWPLEPDGAATNAFVVADCPDEPGVPAGALVSPLIRFLADYDAMLNVAEMTNVAGTRRARDDFTSTGQNGRRSENFGYPMSGVFTQAADMPPILNRIVNRVGAIVSRVELFEVDARLDPDWVPVLTALDMRDPVTVHRAGLPVDLTLDGVVVGYQHRITPNQWSATVYTRTLDPS